MKNILVALVGLAVIGCADNNKQTPNSHKMELDNTSKYHDQNYRVYTLEGCEYIVVGYGKTQWGFHIKEIVKIQFIIQNSYDTKR